jgi:hypothetical protein
MRAHRRKNQAARGVALAETALTMSLVLLVLLGLIKLVFVGYEQAQADGAAFIAAHAESLGNGTAARGEQHARTAFPGYPPDSGTEGIYVQPGTAGSNGDLGQVVAEAKRVAGGLFLGTGVGAGAPAQINLHSFIVEPVADPGGDPPVFSATVNGGAPNCNGGLASSKTTNLAVANGTPWGCSMNLSVPDFKNSPKDPYQEAECHLAYYASLTNSGVTLNNINWAKYGNFDPSSLTNEASGAGQGGGQTLTQHPWPTEYQTSSGGSINDPNVRGAGTYLTTQTPQQNIGGGASGGLLGTQLTPIFMFGVAASGPYSDPCAS